MADTVRMVGPDGAAYDIPKAMEPKAFADGLRPDRSLFEKAADIASDTPVGKALSYAAGKDLQLGDLARQLGQEVLIGKDGATYVMPATEAKDAVAKGGLRLPDMADDRDRALVARAEAGIDPSNEGVRGAIKAAGSAARNEFVKTATFGALDLERDMLTAEQRAASEQASELNPTASAVGGAAGLVGGLVVDPFSVGGLATKAGASAVERAGLAGAESLAGRMAGGALKSGVAGTVMAAPAAGRALLEGDAERAGEMLLIGGGLGGVFGAAGPVLAKGATVLERGVTRAVEHGIAAIEKSGLSEAEYLAQKAGKIATKAGEGIGGLVGGWPGAVIGRGVGEAFGAAAERVVESEAGQKAIRRGLELVGNGLRALPQALEEMGTGRLARGVEVKTEDAFSKALGVPEKGSKEERWPLIQEAVTKLATDPEHRIEKVAQASTVEGIHPDAASAYNARIQSAIDYVFGAMPKDPTAGPGMFTSRAPWMPSDAEFARMNRRMQAIADPISAIEAMKKGTLTRDHVEALEIMYPQALSEWRKKVDDVALSPTAPTLTTAQRAQVDLFMGRVTERSRQPKSVSQYQAVYASQDPKDDGNGMQGAAFLGTTPPSLGRPIRVKGLPSTASDTQQLQTRRRG